ncbi:hypothetical protein [Kitasatospora sp. NPDC050463]|uniref:hypothetical protein n=1 Tax=Kitasatospora sp. NPDC050463 TaxID=3155786 RepID=UPI0033BFCD6E
MSSMNSMNRARVGGLAAAAGLVPVALGLALGWPAWVWAVAAGFVVVVVLQLVWRGSGERPAPQSGPDPSQAYQWNRPGPVPTAAQTFARSTVYTTAPSPSGPTAASDSAFDPGRADSGLPQTPAAPVEVPYQEARVENVALPSGVPDYDFVFSATVRWRPLPQVSGLVHTNLGGLAVDTVLARAKAVTEREHPARPDLVWYRLAGVLGLAEQDASGLVVAMAEKIALRIPEADQARLDQMAEVRKTAELWEHELRHERTRRAYLGEDVLKSTGSAVVWWLARNSEEVQQTVDMIGPLAQLSAAANDQAVDVLYRHMVAGADVAEAAAQLFSGETGGAASAATDRVAGAEPGADAGAWSGAEPGKLWSAPGPWPTPTIPEPSAGPDGQPDGPRRGPVVVGPLNDLMDDVDISGEDERTVYAHRIARLTEAMGRPEGADLIKASLAEPEAEGDAGAAAPVGFVPGPVRPGTGQPVHQPAGDAGPGDSDEEGPVVSAWEVLRDSVNGGGSEEPPSIIGG